jgi:hypothetical protein
MWWWNVKGSLAGWVGGTWRQGNEYRGDSSLSRTSSSTSSSTRN